ncbi:MAG: hypothetical protein NTU44_05165, partial [Bacteroidetes bacterium]|nr:hypothetical protein [Bacteroidota bacterium]
KNNGRITISEPHYHKVINGLGVVVTLGGAFAGGYIGYNASIFTSQLKEKRVETRELNAIIGAGAGYSLLMLGNYIFGLNTIKNEVNPQKWTRKFSHDYTLIPSGVSHYSFDILPFSIEKNYTAHNISELKEFKSAFPISPYTDAVIKNSLPYLEKAELPQVIDLYPNVKSLSEVKIEHLYRCIDYYELQSLYARYAPLDIDIEPLSEKLVDNVNKAIDFASMFPQSKRFQRVIINACKQTLLPKEDALRIFNTFPEQYLIPSADFSSFPANDLQKSNYLKVLFYNAKFIKPDDIANFFIRFSYIQYPGIEKDILEYSWETNYPLMEDKNALIGQLLDYPVNPFYRSLKITAIQSRAFLMNKFKSFLDDLRKTSVNTYNPQDTAEKALFAHLDPAASGHDKQYLVLCNIRNNSELDLPVRITVSAKVTSLTASSERKYRVRKALNIPVKEESLDWITTEKKDSVQIPVFQHHSNTTALTYFNFGPVKSHMIQEPVTITYSLVENVDPKAFTRQNQLINQVVTHGSFQGKEINFQACQNPEDYWDHQQKTWKNYQAGH